MPVKDKSKALWVWVRYRVPPELRRRFKLACVREGLSMNEVLVSYMEKFSDWSEGKEKG